MQAAAMQVKPFDVCNEYNIAVEKQSYGIMF
jgi:hypothetical protein